VTEPASRRFGRLRRPLSTTAERCGGARVCTAGSTRVGTPGGPFGRALRGEGVTLAAALVAVAASVRPQVAPDLSGEACDAVERDAVRSCLEAYYGP
jgi:hypothetical protein